MKWNPLNSTLFFLLIIIPFLSCSSQVSQETKVKSQKLKTIQMLTAAYSLFHRYGLIEKSIKYLNQIGKLNPDSLHIVEFDLALIYLKINKTEKSILHFKKAIQANSAFAFPHFLLGQTYLEKRLLPQAVNHFQLAIKIYNQKLNGSCNKDNCDGLRVDYNDCDGLPEEMEKKRALSYGQIGYAGDLMNDAKIAIPYTRKSKDQFLKLSSKLPVGYELQVAEKLLAKMIQKYKLTP